MNFIVDWEDDEIRHKVLEIILQDNTLKSLIVISKKDRFHMTENLSSFTLYKHPA